MNINTGELFQNISGKELERLKKLFGESSIKTVDEPLTTVQKEESFIRLDDETSPAGVKLQAERKKQD